MARPDVGNSSTASGTPGAEGDLPVVRKLARDGGLDVAALAGSGPAGVVLRRDVEAALLPMIMSPERRRRGRWIPLRGVRRSVAEKLTRSRREIPDATAWVDVDATGLVEARDALRGPIRIVRSACWHCWRGSSSPGCAGIQSSTPVSTVLRSFDSPT